MRRFVLQVLLWIALLGVCSPVAAETASQKLLLLSGNSCAGSALTLDILNGVYCTPGQRVSNLLSLPGASFTRTSTKTALNKAGQVVSFASGVPAITDLGWLDELAGTNLLLQSGDMTQAAWTKTRTTATADASVTTPQGTSSTKVAGTGAAFAFNRQSFAVSGSTTYTFQTALEKGSGVGVVLGLFDGTSNWLLNLNTTTGAASINGTNTGTFVSFSNPAKVLANGFWLFNVTVTTAAGATSMNMDTYVAPGFSTGASPTSADFYRFGFAQAETGTAATSYIPTTVAAVTRAADALPLTYSGSPTTATVTYGSGSTANPSATSPLNLGSSSGGAWVGSYVTKVVVR